MPKLQVSLPEGAPSDFDLTEASYSIGRLADNAIQIDDASVSSHHGELILDGGDYILKDLDSTNGTRLNGVRHTEGKLQDGDQITFGNIDAVYASENPADARPMPEESTVDLQPASQSVPPSNFENASPFQTKTKKKDPAATAVLVFAGVAILAFVAAVLSVLSLKSPL